MKNNLIGIAGPAGSGKSLLASMIEETAAFHAIRMPFAGQLKNVMRDLGWDGEKDEKGRWALQVVGTDIGRHYDNNIWVKKWSKMYETWRDKGFCVIADDIRFENEVAKIKEEGGLLVYLLGRQSDLGNNSNHSSEQNLSQDLFNITYFNTGSKDGLKRLAGRVIYEICERNRG